MRWLKVAGVLVGVFLLLGFVFIEPAKGMPRELAGLYVLVGVAVCVPLAWWGIRRVLRHGRP